MPNGEFSFSPEGQDKNRSVEFTTGLSELPTRLTALVKACDETHSYLLESVFQDLFKFQETLEQQLLKDSRGLGLQFISISIKTPNQPNQPIHGYFFTERLYDFPFEKLVSRVFDEAHLAYNRINFSYILASSLILEPFEGSPAFTQPTFSNFISQFKTYTLAICTSRILNQENTLQFEKVLESLSNETLQSHLGENISPITKLEIKKGLIDTCISIHNYFVQLRQFIFEIITNDNTGKYNSEWLNFLVRYNIVTIELQNLNKFLEKLN
ncbi:MAG: hypothetical protein OHK0017_02680 [Patescibacteria group bacterium]